MSNIWLKTIKEEDLEELWQISFGPKADLKWMAYNGPYFKDPIQTWETFAAGYGKSLINQPTSKIIMENENMIGIVTAYWEDGNLKQWLEVGIVLYQQATWGKGVGSKALSIWLKELFELFSYLPHIGFTTWSGNPGMMKLGEKVGMTKEGVIRKVRFLDGHYYDSVKYGILREEIKN